MICIMSWVYEYIESILGNVSVLGTMHLTTTAKTAQ